MAIGEYGCRKEEAGREGAGEVSASLQGEKWRRWGNCTSSALDRIATSSSRALLVVSINVNMQRSSRKLISQLNGIYKYSSSAHLRT